MVGVNRRFALEVGDILREFGPAYQQAHRLPLRQLKVMGALAACRTKTLGGHLEVCDTCGRERPAYNSCRNRHCPKCGWLAKEKWLRSRKQEIVPVAYFHVVLTLPDLLNPLTRVNQKVMYDILFKAGSETLLDLGRDPKHLGAQIGFMAVLHTWGQNLLDHPHLHCVLPCGGLSEDGMEWIEPRKSKKRKKFFVHGNVLSDLFKKKFLYYLNRAYENGQLKFVGQVVYLADPAEFKKLKNQLYRKRWVTYCEAPFAGPEQVLDYLASYTHRVAISNHRLLKIADGRVYLKWKNYRRGTLEIMSLEIFEFIRRLLLHVLPKGFFKIRYYGLLASRNREKLRLCQEILGLAAAEEKSELSDRSWEDWFLELTGVEPGICPYCRKGRLVPVADIKPVDVPP